MFITRDSIQPIASHDLDIYDYTAEAKTSSSLATVRMPPGGQHGEAWSRRSDKYYYVLAGTVQFVVNDSTAELGEGDCCIVYMGEHFSYKNNTSEPATLLLLHTPSFDLQAEVFVDE